MRHERYIKQVEAHAVVKELTAIRKAWDLPKENIAHRALCSYNTICHLESGKANPSLKLLDRWANALGYEVVLRKKSIFE